MCSNTSSNMYQKQWEKSPIDLYFLWLQIQNEFIQQGCRNFRLVPVLFPNATKVRTSKEPVKGLGSERLELV